MQTTTEINRWSKTPTIERFTAKVDKVDGGCWNWTASLNNYGYGRFRLDGRTVLAHRWAYQTWIGPIGDGLTVDHLCRNRSCVNPEHLEAVTLRDNIRRTPRCLRDKAPRKRYPQKRAEGAAHQSRRRRARSENVDNLPGIYQHQNGGWAARGRRQGARHHLGTYDTPAEAHAAYIAWKATP